MAAYKNCEIISKFSSSSSSESEDSDCSASQYSTSTGKSKSTATSTTTVQRLPTRRPDPNVSNRNALLARENRRRKKEYLETLEKELDSMKHVNKKLHKTLKKHMKLVKKLEHEKQYYKDLVSNQNTGIRDLVSVLHGKIPAPYPLKESSCSPTDSNRSSSSNFDDNQFVYDPNTDQDNDSDYSAMYSAAAAADSNWDTILGLNDDPEQFFKMSSSSSSTTCDVINDEHNYYQSPPDSGVCMHSVEGTLPLEDCLSCEKFSSSSCCQLPEELLVVEWRSQGNHLNEYFFRGNVAKASLAGLQKLDFKGFFNLKKFC